MLANLLLLFEVTESQQWTWRRVLPSSTYEHGPSSHESPTDPGCAYLDVSRGACGYVKSCAYFCGVVGYKHVILDALATVLLLSKSQSIS